MSDADALFVRDGDRFLPGLCARGPWSPEAQHGGAPAALLATCLERAGGGDLHPARLTLELLRPVPIAPLVVDTAITRPGKKVQIVEARLRAGDTEVARASLLRIRRADLPLPASIVRATPPAGPETGVDGMPPWIDATWRPAFHRDAVEHRFVDGSFQVPGPATDWIRLRVPVIAGERPTPLARVMAAADFGNGISWELHRADGWQFINPDLTVYLHRLPAGEWVCLQSASHMESHGVGVAESRLWDETRPLGRATQSLLLERV